MIPIRPIPQQHAHKRSLNVNLNLRGGINVQRTVEIEVYSATCYEMDPIGPMTVEIFLYDVMDNEMDHMQVTIMNGCTICLAFEIFVLDILNNIFNSIYCIAIFKITILISSMKISKIGTILGHFVCNEDGMSMIDFDSASDEPSWSMLGIDGGFDYFDEFDMSLNYNKYSNYINKNSNVMNHNETREIFWNQSYFKIPNAKHDALMLNY